MKRRINISVTVAIVACLAASVKTGIDLASWQAGSTQRIAASQPGDVRLEAQPGGNANLPGTTLTEQLRDYPAVAQVAVEADAKANFQGKKVRLLGADIQAPLRNFDFIVPPDPDSRYLSGAAEVEPVLMHSRFALKHYLRVGDVFQLSLNGETHRLVATAIYRGAGEMPDLVVEHRSMAFWLKEDRVNRIILVLRDRADAAQVIEQLQASHPEVLLTDVNALRKRLLRQERLLAVFGYAGIIALTLALIAGILHLNSLGRQTTRQSLTQ